MRSHNWSAINKGNATGAHPLKPLVAFCWAGVKICEVAVPSPRLSSVSCPKPRVRAIQTRQRLSLHARAGLEQARHLEAETGGASIQWPIDRRLARLSIE